MQVQHCSTCLTSDPSENSLYALAKFKGVRDIPKTHNPRAGDLASLGRALHWSTAAAVAGRHALDADLQLLSRHPRRSGTAAGRPGAVPLGDTASCAARPVGPPERQAAPCCAAARAAPTESHGPSPQDPGPAHIGPAIRIP